MSEELSTREPTGEDIPALARFARSVPTHDLLFLGRDIREAKVLEAWVRAQTAGDIASFVALDGSNVVATIAAVSDRLSWSPHVWDVRLLVAPEWRNRGLGRRLLESAIAAACERGATKLTARMTPDQVGAITLFEESGFRAEALLRDQVRDDGGTPHDIAVLALDPQREAALHDAFRD